MAIEVEPTPRELSADPLPERVFSGMGPVQGLGKGGMVRVRPVVLDDRFDAGAGVEMAGGVAVAFGAALLQRETDHRPPDQGCGQRVLGLQQIRGGCEDVIGLAVKLAAAGQDQISAQTGIGPRHDGSSSAT